MQNEAVREGANNEKQEERELPSEVSEKEETSKEGQQKDSLDL
jgi:hypothetical protein